MSEPAVAVFILVSAGMFWLGFFASWVDTKRKYERRSRELEEKKKAYKKTVDGMMQAIDIKSTTANIIPITARIFVEPSYYAGISGADSLRIGVAVERQNLRQYLGDEIWKYAKVEENRVPGAVELTATVNVVDMREGGQS